MNEQRELYHEGLIGLLELVWREADFGSFGVVRCGGFRRYRLPSISA